MLSCFVIEAGEKCSISGRDNNTLCIFKFAKSCKTTWDYDGDKMRLNQKSLYTTQHQDVQCTIVLFASGALGWMGEFLNEGENIMKWRCNVGYVCHSVINVFHGGGKTVGLMIWPAMSTEYWKNTDRISCSVWKLFAFYCQIPVVYWVDTALISAENGKW